MSEPVRVLIVEDDPVDADLMVRELKRGGFTPDWVRVQTESEYLAELEKEPEVILSDSNLPLFDGFEALDLLRKRGLDIPFILVSGRMGEDVAVDAMRRGAFDYLLKDRLARLGEAVRRALHERRLRAERTWAVGALRQSEERYRLVSEASSDYVYSLKVDPDGTLTCEWITDPFSRITGFDAAEINLRGWASLYHPEDLAIANQHRESLLVGQSDSIEARIVTKEKRVRWIRVHERPVFSREDRQRVERIYGAAQDITVQKQLEEQLLQSRKMEAIGQLAGGVAHDFNNLLTVICGYGDLLEKLPDLSATGREYADEILEAAKRASQLTRQLLAFGRRQVMQSRTVNLNGIVADIEKLLRRLIGEDVELRTVLDPELGLVKVDPGQIEQVIMNLAVNARDAMPRGGRLTIETANIAFDRNHPDRQAMPQGGPHVMLAVSDTGSGMDAQTAARAFEPFFTTKELGKGTGLGLAMAYGIVKQSGGDIRVYTELGRGTTFKIYLPRLENAVEAVAEPAPFNLRAMHGTETILVLEDENALRHLIRQVLCKAGHTVLDTGDPDEAIQLCERHPGDIALFITDMVLPKLSGPQVAERVLQLRPGMRVIYTSGYPGKASIPTKLRQNGTTFFEKPFTPDTLVRKVRAVLDADAA
jgi:two-component system, cell cycle sensor histidine kinase and response regulator CckA